MTSYLCTPPSFVAQCFIWGCVCVCDWSVVMISASEPNLKVRSALKQKLESQRRITHSPILPRKNKFVKRKPQLSCMYLYIMQGLFFRTQFLFWKHRGMVISIFIFLPSFFSYHNVTCSHKNSLCDKFDVWFVFHCHNGEFLTFFFKQLIYYITMTNLFYE